MESFYYFYVYILECKDGSYYVGHTDNLEQRVADHNNGTFLGYTASRLPVTLVWVDNFSTRDEAFAAERHIKSWSHMKKQAFIKADWEKLKEHAKKFF